MHLFYSYAQEDEPFQRQMQTHLAGLSNAGLLTEWHTGLLQPGQMQEATVAAQLASADVVVLLLSADFFRRDSCYLDQMETALRRHQSGKAHIVPVLVRPTDLLNTPLCALARLPRDGRAVTEQADRDRAWVEIAEHVRALLAPASSAPPARHPSHPDGRYQRDHHIHHLRFEKAALRDLRDGRPHVLQGPMFAGKRWLADHLVDVYHSQMASVHAVRIDISKLPAEACGSEDALLSAVCDCALSSLGQRARAKQTWQQRLDALFQVHPPGELLLVLLHLEVLKELGPIRDAFFVQLRALVERPPSLRPRLLCTVSVAPTELERQNSSKFFTVAGRSQMDGLDRADLRPLATLDGLDPTDEQLDRLWSLLAGHPYLCRLAFYEAADSTYPLQELLKDPLHRHSPLLPFLADQAAWLAKVGLLELMTAVAGNPRHAVSLDAFYQLYQQGLLTQDNLREHHVRPPLLATYLRKGLTGR